MTVALLAQLQSLGTAVVRALTGERLLLDFRTRLFRHLQRLSVSYHDLRGTSDSTYRIQYDALAVQQIAVDSIPSFLTATFTLVSMLYVTAVIDWQLALVAVAVSRSSSPCPGATGAGSAPSRGRSRPGERGDVHGPGDARGDPGGAGLRSGGARGAAVRPSL